MFQSKGVGKGVLLKNLRAGGRLAKLVSWGEVFLGVAIYMMYLVVAIYMM